MLLSSTCHNLAKSLLLFWSARLWTRFEYNHLPTSIHPGSCISIQAHTDILHRYCDSLSLRLHVVTYRTCVTPTHTSSSTCTHTSLTLMWSDQTELPANRPSDWTVNVGPHYPTWQHRFALHTHACSHAHTHTHTITHTHTQTHTHTLRVGP